MLITGSNLPQGLRITVVPTLTSIALSEVDQMTTQWSQWRRIDQGLQVLAAGVALVAFVAAGALTSHPMEPKPIAGVRVLLADTACDTTQQDEDDAEEQDAQQQQDEEQQAEQEQQDQDELQQELNTQQMLQDEQQTQEAEQQAEVENEQAEQQAEQDEQQALLDEQEAQLSVPGN